MACEECGGLGRGMACRHCPGAATRPPGRGGAGALVAVGCLVVVVLVGALSLRGAEDLPPAAEADPPVRTVPTRNGPTAFPGGRDRAQDRHGRRRRHRHRRRCRHRRRHRHRRLLRRRPPHLLPLPLEGWYTVRTGGYGGGGCDGRFSALPMSGSPTEDHDNAAVWTWRVDPAYRTCGLTVHVPRPPRPQDAAGAPSVYQLLADGTPYATFTLDQHAHPGALLPAGTHRLRTPTFTVRLLDRGQDWGIPAREGAHHAAAQMRLTCRRP